MKKHRQRAFCMVRKTTAVFFMFIFLAGSMDVPAVVKAAAEVRVYITEGTLNHAINRTMTVGEERSGWGIELNRNRTVKSAAWSSSDTRIATVSGDTSGAVVTTHAEGTAVLRLVVVTNENETVSDECLISSITRLPEEKQAEGYVKKSAAFYRGASRDSQIRNTAGAGQKLTVFGLCGDFYRVRLPADYDFEDTLDQETAYALKSDIEIPVASVSITNAGEAEHMKTGDQIKLETALLPELASRKKLTWKSSNEKVAQVDSDGTVTAKRAGNARITVTEAYSGMSASCPVQVSHSLPGAAVAKGTVKLDIEVDSDYGGNHVVWYSLENMDEYRLYIGTWDKKKKKIVYKKHRVLEDRYYHAKAKKGVTYYYYVQGISGGRTAGKSKRVKIKAAMPRLTVTTQSLSSLKLDWTTGKEKKVKKFSEYQLYRSSKKKGTYKKIKTIRKKGVHTWTDKKRKSGTTYYYKVALYQKKQGKKIKWGESPVVSATTYSEAMEQTNWQYFDRMREKWKGVYFERGTVSKEKSSQTMKDCYIKQSEDLTYPPVKYHLTTDVLYIHVYAEYCRYEKTGGRVAKKALPEEKFTYRGKEYNKTFREMFKEALSEAYAVEILGNAQDFAPGVRFRTELVLHEKGRESYNQNQKFMEVCIGGACYDVIRDEACSEDGWFHYDSAMYSPEDVVTRMYLPLNAQLKERPGTNEMSMEAYQAYMIHEMGHACGLDDGYGTEDSYTGKHVDRMAENLETCHLNQQKQWENIMLQCYTKSKVKANDIEMMLQSYGFESYQSYYLNGGDYKMSDAIKNGKDENDENEEN